MFTIRSNFVTRVLRTPVECAGGDLLAVAAGGVLPTPVGVRRTRATCSRLPAGCMSVVGGL